MLARRAVSALAATATGGTSKGAEILLRLFPLIMAVCAFAVVLVGLTVIGLLAGSPSSASAVGDCAVASTGSGGPPADLIPIYSGAASQYQLGPYGWAYLAAINRVETNFGRDLAVSGAGAIGWMQFEPGTWSQYAVSADPAEPGSAPDPYDPYDAIYSAANMLHGNGAPANWSQAIFAYNHSSAYVQQVSDFAVGYVFSQDGADQDASGSASSSGPSTCAVALTTPGASAQILPDGLAAAPAEAPPQVQEAIAAGNEIIDAYYRAQRPEPLNTVMPWYDCSASTDYVLFNSGLDGPGVTAAANDAGNSTMLESYGENGKGQWITVYANPKHAFIEVAGVVLDTAWYAPVEPALPASGPRWQPASIIPAQIKDDVLGWFDKRHPVGL
jgi:hypothetical protein